MYSIYNFQWQKPKNTIIIAQCFVKGKQLFDRSLFVVSQQVIAIFGKKKMYRLNNSIVQIEILNILYTIVASSGLYCCTIFKDSNYYSDIANFSIMIKLASNFLKQNLVQCYRL